MSVVNADQFVPQKGDRIFLDTNIIIKQFWAISFESNKYCDVCEKISNSGATLLISSIQFSEFINYCLRLQFNLYKEDKPEVTDFKRHYKGTDDYNNTIKAIFDSVKNDICPHFTCVDDGFQEMEKDNVFKDCYGFDFNDLLIAQIAKKESAYVLTNDGDYIYLTDEIDVITLNPIILAANKR